MTLRFCHACGKEAEPDALFCGNCGSRLNDAPVFPAPVSPVVPQATVNAAPFAPEPVSNVGPGLLGSFGYCIRNCFNFKGRATRTEYLGWFLVSNLILYVGDFAGDFAREAEVADFAIISLATALWNLLFNVLFFLPRVAVSVRRAHDFGLLGLPVVACLVVHAIFLFESLGTYVWNHFTFEFNAPYLCRELYPCNVIACWLNYALLACLIAIPGSRQDNAFGARRFSPRSARRELKKQTAFPGLPAQTNAQTADANASNDGSAPARTLEELLALLNNEEPTVSPSFFGSYWHAWKHALDFTNRANLTEWWGFHVVYAALFCALCVVLAYVHDLLDYSFDPSPYFIAAFVVPGLPVLALTWRRLHDFGKSG
ncbi:MAG: DUF805 domain-containing protein, partial [Thermoguttaceae bacterium]|nr:DUF805 domain-containing protein [Thermoguttaceae bacterium]